MTARDYRPIDCGVHDRIESWAVRRTPVTLRFADDEGRERERAGRIVDVFARDGAEFLVLHDRTEVRLDRLRSIEAL
jgi:Rho-binding antiterminator